MEEQDRITACLAGLDDTHAFPAEHQFASTRDRVAGRIRQERLLEACARAVHSTFNRRGARGRKPSASECEVAAGSIFRTRRRRLPASSRRNSYFFAIAILCPFAFACGVLGILTVSTPSLNSATILLGSIVRGSVNARRNAPYVRSQR